MCLSNVNLYRYTADPTEQTNLVADASLAAVVGGPVQAENPVYP
jgi:hypothetical protein